ncbi:MAG: MerR family transcriptional regulator [Dehalococcoidia bacterium]|nr:MerR family transcriptional regulator [Dehalococcoidia bacterium]
MPQESDTGPETTPAEEPTYVISVAAKMVGVAAQTLRYYERQGLVQPQRSQGKIRLYCQSEVDRLRRIKGLIDDLGVNLAGVEVILRMADRMAAMERAMREVSTELEQLRQAPTRTEGNAEGRLKE